MARVTVEGCVDKVPNRFDLVVLSAERSRQLGQGALLMVERENDKNTVVSLREIEGNYITPDSLHDALVKKHQCVPEVGSEDDIEVKDLMKEEQNWIAQPESEEMRTEIFQDHLEVETADQAGVMTDPIMVIDDDA